MRRRTPIFRSERDMSIEAEGAAGQAARDQQPRRVPAALGPVRELRESLVLIGLAISSLGALLGLAFAAVHLLSR